MKLFLKCLAILALVLALLAAGDNLLNGLFNKDGYKSVTEQMKDVMSDPGK